ncbi:MAG: ABC transporter substrate-binding protein, partial [Candidatus Korarchaeota archaeon]|nr:ABC transporter substrate-binding protein [Candidatus Korarchaeota archaeon]
MAKGKAKIIGMSIVLAVILLSMATPPIAHAQEAKVLQIGIPGEIDNFNPLIGLFGAAGYIRGLLFDTLLIMPANRSYCPWLAENWTINEQNLEITFKLRPNLKWHDGKPLT